MREGADGDGGDAGAGVFADVVLCDLPEASVLQEPPQKATASDTRAGLRSLPLHLPHGARGIISSTAILLFDE